jgi:hypothetical protein
MRIKTRHNGGERCVNNKDYGTWLYGQQFIVSKPASTIRLYKLTRLLILGYRFSGFGRPNDNNSNIKINSSCPFTHSINASTMGLILKRYIRHLGGPPEDGYYSDLDEDAICRSGSEIHDTVSDPGEDENATARFQSSSPPTTPLDAPLLLRTSAYDRSSLDISLPRNLNFTELRQYPIGSAHDTRSEIWQINGLLEWKDRTHDCLWKAWGTAWKFWHLPDGPKVNLLWYNAMVEAGCSESDASHAATEVICPLEQKHVPMSRSPPDLIINGIDPVANSLWTPDPPKVEMMTNSSRGAGVNKAIVMDTKTRLIRVGDVYFF